MQNRLQEFSCLAVVLFASACGGGSGTTAPPGPVAIVSVSAPASVVVTGGTLQMSASAADAKGTPVTGQAVTWASSNQTIATVSSSGLVTGVAAGSVSISATVSGIVGSAQLAVAPPSSTASVTATTGSQFSPSQVDIVAGGTVTWVFQSLTHNVTFTTTAAGTPTNIGDTSGASVSRTFTTAGTFAYHCTIHAGMNGTVVVH